MQKPASGRFEPISPSNGQGAKIPDKEEGKILCKMEESGYRRFKSTLFIFPILSKITLRVCVLNSNLPQMVTEKKPQIRGESRI